MGAMRRLCRRRQGWGKAAPLPRRRNEDAWDSSSGVTGKEDLASEDGGSFGLDCAGGEGVAQRIRSGAIAGLGTHGGDSTLEEEMAIGGVKDNLAGGSGSKAAG